MVVNCTFEVVDRDVVAECASCDIVVLKDRSSGKTDTMGGRKQPHHILGVNAVLCAVGFITHQDNIVFGRVWFSVWIVEFMN